MATRKIGSFNELSVALNTAGKGFEAELNKAIAKATLRVQADAIKKFGNYQMAVGPFNEWEDLADATVREKRRAGAASDDPLIGHYTAGRKNSMYPAPLRNSILSEVRGLVGYVGTNNPLGKIHEFGSVHIPPRPFLRPALYQNQTQIKTWMKEAIAIALSK